MTVKTHVHIYRPLAEPGPWFLGHGFNTWLADLGEGDTAPTTKADALLAGFGITRTGEWLPHRTRGQSGWLTAEVRDSIEWRPGVGE